MKRTGPTNKNLLSLITELRKKSIEGGIGLWKSAAFDLERPSRSRRFVNISKINRSTKENEVILVPGKILSSGALDHKITVAAFNFSKQAKEKIEKAGGKIMTIPELMKQNPKGTDIRIVG